MFIGRIRLPLWRVGRVSGSRIEGIRPDTGERHFEMWRKVVLKGTLVSQMRMRVAFRETVIVAVF